MLILYKLVACGLKRRWANQGHVEEQENEQDYMLG